MSERTTAIERRTEMAVGGRGIQPRSLTELQRMGEMMVRGGIAPKGMTPEGACAVMLFGMELGLSPIQSLRDICFINGRPTAYGDAVSGLINRSGLLAGAPEVAWTGSGDSLACTVTMKRKGVPGTFRGEYSIAKAKRAGLVGKDNWRAYPERMVYWRAYTYAARDGFSDVLKGLTTREEAMDLPAEEYRVIDSRVVPAPAPISAPPTLPLSPPAPEAAADDLERELSEAEGAPTAAPARAADAELDEIGREGARELAEKPAPAPAAPPEEASEREALWKRLSAMRNDLGKDGIAKVKAAAGVEVLSRDVPLEALRVAVQVAQDLTR